MSLKRRVRGRLLHGRDPAPHRPLRVPRRLAGPGGLLLGRRRPFRLLPPGTAAGGWLAVPYAGQTLFAKASDVSLNDGSGSFTGYFSERTDAYGMPAEEAGPVDFFWGGVAVSVSRWDAGGEWCTLVYGGETLFVRASALSIGDSPDGRSYRGTTLTRTNLYVAPSLQAEVGDFFWADITWSGFQHWDAADEWLTVTYAGVRYFVRAEDVELDDGSANPFRCPQASL